MKYAIIGSALAGNKGAAAMLESAVQQLSERDADARVTLLSMYPRSDAAQNEYSNLTVLDASPLRLGVLINSAALAYRLLPPARAAIAARVPEVAALASADVLLDQGGITFVDGRGKFLIYNVASVLPALFVGTPVVKCAQALGPFKTFLNSTAAKAILPRMAAIVSRGAVSQEHLEGLGLKNTTAGADLAFTLDVTERDIAAARSAVDVTFFDGNDVIGISPSAVLRKSAEAKGGNYVAEVQRMVDYFTGVLGKKVFLVAHSARANTDKAHNNDLPLCREIYAGVERKDMVLFPDAELSSQSLRYLIGRCDLFVASRFHAMVSSLAMQVPTLVIGWSHKYREVLDMFGLAQWAMGHDVYTDDAFQAKFAELAATKTDVRATLAEAFPRVRATALEQVDVILRVASGARKA
ncbi:polysaccharide pyruvyl transferase family protein [Sanguibacter antarcticus]|uniref:Polysaccharide pyruvyl transferase WcaK-like protein n=1 Tax=Sanguibacter antarcticus TaxID=372484 RepID=A0A2A9E1K5_9MICO|nr:polysaccharide pyruvyl transferase family protein [Sanguibacter antarcticus]PFG32526.1 polysaccharide pyruvyl transferase WcaK-like protein [Sanguibacter antarcticus]